MAQEKQTRYGESWNMYSSALPARADVTYCESDIKAVAFTVNQRSEMGSGSRLELRGKTFCQADTFSKVYGEEIHGQVILPHLDQIYTSKGKFCQF